MALVSHLAPAALLLTTFAPFALSAEFADPRSIKSLDGVLSTSIDLDWVEIKNIGSIFPKPFVTRAVGGSVPGPTLRVSPGDTLEVEFCNKLTKQEGSRQDTPNRVGEPDTANLHFHGGHVSSVLPADDTTLNVLPGTCYSYSIDIPEDHIGGINWIHPHHHGSTTLHLAGGAAMAFIVEDPDDASYLPEVIKGADEKVMVFQYWDMDALLATAFNAGDTRMMESIGATGLNTKRAESFFTVNGDYQPTISMVQGEWQRWRVLFAGWDDTSLKFKLEEEATGADDSCEMQLLAKDGIYIQDFPRHVKDLPIPPGGRAEIMIRCNNVGTTFVKTIRRVAIKVEVMEASEEVVETETTSATSRAIEAWSPTKWPSYLADLQNEPISDGCDCETELDGYGLESFINGKRYRSGNSFLHTSYLGATVQRTVKGIHDHSYHQHVYPFQILGFKEGNPDEGYDNYFKVGDWHDTWYDEDHGEEASFLRYRPTVFPGKIMVHCHFSLHADNGMFAKEYVLNLTESTGGKCACDVHGEISGPGIVDFIGDYADENNAGSSGCARSSFLSVWLCLGFSLVWTVYPV